MEVLTPDEIENLNSKPFGILSPDEVFVLAVTVNIKRLSYLSPSSGISIVCRADSWRRRHAKAQLSALPNNGDAARWR